MPDRKALRYTEQVWEDLLSAAQWYEDKRDGLGDEFEEEFFIATASVADAPEMYAADHTSYRACRLSRFNAVLYYRIEPDCVLIIGLLVGGRHPNALEGRG